MVATPFGIPIIRVCSVPGPVFRSVVAAPLTAWYLGALRASPRRAIVIVMQHAETAEPTPVFTFISAALRSLPDHPTVQHDIESD